MRMSQLEWIAWINDSINHSSRDLLSLTGGLCHIYWSMTVLKQPRDKHKNSNNPNNFWVTIYRLLRGCASSSSWFPSLGARPCITVSKAVNLLCINNNTCKHEERGMLSSYLQRLDKVWKRMNGNYCLCFMETLPFQSKKTDIRNVWQLIFDYLIYKQVPIKIIILSCK